MKKNYLILAFLFSSIMFGQQTFFNNTSSDGKWSTLSNWSSGALPNSTSTTALTQLNADVNLDINATLTDLRSAANTLTGTGKLTISSAGVNTIGLLSLGANFTFDAAVEFAGTTTNVEALQVNNTSGASYKQLTLGPNSILTATCNVRTVPQFDSKVVFQGKIEGTGGVQFGPGPGIAEFASTSDNSGYNGDMVFFGANSIVVSNNVGAGTFLKAGRKVQVNNSGTLTLNGANTYNGNLTVSASNVFTLNVNQNQETFGTITVGNGSIAINVNAAVTNLSFANSAAAVWGTGTVVFTGYQAGKIRFGTDNTALTAGQLAKITADGVATGQALGLDINGYLIVPSLPSTWTGGTSTAWNNSLNWTNGVPSATTAVTIGTGTFQPTLSVNASVKSLTINSGASLQVNSGFNLTVKEAIANNGSLTISNNANLIQVDNVTNTGSGTTTVRRNSNALKRLDFTLWSSPVFGAQTLANFSPLTSQTPNRFYTYGPTGNQYVDTSSAATFTTATGYLIRMPNTDLLSGYDLGTATLEYPGVFTGTANNGNLSVTTTSGLYYGVGNPYPSTLDAALFLSGNTTDGTLYFWRKTNAVANTTGSSYATWTTFGSAASSVAPNDIVPNGTIQVGQGFIVKSNTTSLVFTNTMRLGTVSTQFFKTKQLAQKSRIWLNLTNTADVFSQILVGYVDGATIGVDNGIDGKYINDSPIALTSNINGEEYTIQGRPTFDATDVVSLNFKTNLAGQYTIALDHLDGLFDAGQDVYLVDSKTGVETDLKAGAYNFTAGAGSDNNRFSLKYQKTLTVNESAFNENSVKAYCKNGILYVNSANVAIKNIQVYDVQGRLIAKRDNVNATAAEISNLNENQVLIVKIASEDNSEVAKKVLN